MQTMNYWKQFESTGKIEDYLSYKTNDSQRSVTDKGNAGCKSDYEGYYAGIHTGDRNDFETVPHGRI